MWIIVLLVTWWNEKKRNVRIAYLQYPDLHFLKNIHLYAWCWISLPIPLSYFFFYIQKFNKIYEIIPTKKDWINVYINDKQPKLINNKSWTSSDLANDLTIPWVFNPSLQGGGCSFCRFLWFWGTVPMVIGNHNLMSSL